MQQSPDNDTANSPKLSDQKYRLLGLLIVFFALVLRLFELGERVFHHDESVHASFTLKLLETGEYSYNPAYHGPFLFHSTAAVFHFLGINDTTARLVPVFFGVATILLLFLLKKELGKSGVLWSMFLLAFSPSMVYFSRFFRNDMIIVFCTLAAVAGAFRYLDNIHSSKRYPYLILTAASLAIAVTAKENAYLVILIFGAYAGMGLLYWIYSSWKRENLSLQKTLLLKSSALLSFLPEFLLSGALFIFIVMFFYTSLFRNDISLFSIVERAFTHWMAMHRIERIGGPFYYYIPILFRYEIPVILFGTAGFFHFLNKKGKNASFFLFLCYWAFTSLLLYSYLQEKVPWLVVHIVLPFGILAGACLGDFFSRNIESIKPDQGLLEGNISPLTDKKPFSRTEHAGKARTLTAVILALALLFSLGQCISVNYYRSMEPAELMTYTQASPDIRELMVMIEGFNRRPETLRLYVIDPNKLYWPLPWYLRDYEKTGYSSKPPASSKYDAIIVPISYDMYKEISAEEYSSYNFTLRPGRDFTLYYKKTLEKNG
ncbi:MAG: TIGR03663 family protein [Methanosarcina sp.]|uniref:flippase activity-associated protein Agl23 n=1 Tax=Methanosarcina sp. TaxID=2213 RepID=UPI002602DE0D|nr:flippase activity-associated protein Agl23 [Methanosarcina sp.]MDD3246733.1 TIGR03663 family protein [Methanosarcina sp.]MDD4248790.1 TIGR03663 family protein [Methanosarcina sp.]